MNSIHSEDTDNLFKALLTVESVDELYELFEDLCTINEIMSMSSRFRVARELSEGKTFLQIEESTGASSATISRVNRCYLYGTGGYKKILKKTAEDKNRGDK